MSPDELIEDWNGAPLPVRFSAGASRVPYVEDWRRNLVGLGEGTEVPPWLMREVRGFTAPRTWFKPDDAAALAENLGRISKMQSLRSEDALTWSWFGTLALTSAAHRQEALQWLYDRLDLGCTASASAEIRQWERVHHPHASRNGPHLDAIVDDPAGPLIYVEAKWRAELGTGRGADAGVADDQIVLRRASMRMDPKLAADRRPFVVLGLSQKATDLAAYDEADKSLRPVTIRWMVWNDLSKCGAHPCSEEFEKYLSWKTAVAG